MLKNEGEQLWDSVNNIFTTVISQSSSNTLSSQEFIASCSYVHQVLGSIFIVDSFLRLCLTNLFQRCQICGVSRQTFIASSIYDSVIDIVKTNFVTSSQSSAAKGHSLSMDEASGKKNQTSWLQPFSDNIRGLR